MQTTKMYLLSADNYVIEYWGEIDNEKWNTGLTPREIEVAQRTALGHSNQLIAQDLNITERTVRAHLGAVFTKLGINDRLLLALKVHGLSD